MRSKELEEKYSAFLGAAKAAENAAENSKDAVSRQIAAEREKLAEIIDQQEDAMNALRDTITAGKDDTAARKTLEELTVKRSTAEKVVEAMKEAAGHPDKGLAIEARAAFGELLQQARADINANHERLTEIEEQIKKLEAERRDLYNANDAAGKFTRASTLADRLIRIYEAAFGPIDVTGHTCGPDIEAKHRFVAGISAGIENTPAFRGLKA